jgi:hypothetical protein
MDVSCRSQTAGQCCQTQHPNNCSRTGWLSCTLDGRAKLHVWHSHVMTDMSETPTKRKPAHPVCIRVRTEQWEVLCLVTTARRGSWRCVLECSVC